MIAKRSDVGKCLASRKFCHKVYVARVKGKFPLLVEDDVKRFGGQNGGDGPCVCGEMRETEKKDEEKAALGYWIAGADGNNVLSDVTLEDVFEARYKNHVDDLLDHEKFLQERSLKLKKNAQQEVTMWFHLACPVRIRSHKNGICEAGSFPTLTPSERQGIKSAQTAFCVLSYDAPSDSTLLLAKPFTGRMHQIRLHLQYLNHPIANDANYGGELWYGEYDKRILCVEAKKKMDDFHAGRTVEVKDNNMEFEGKNSKPPEEGEDQILIKPKNATSTDVLATEEEIRQASTHGRHSDESLLSFIQRTCVWCQRSGGDERRTLLEFLVRSRGIWLHALQYCLVGIVESDGDDDGDSEEVYCYRSDLPEWCTSVGGRDVRDVDIG